MNPLMMIGQMMRNGGNPQQIFQQMMGNNPAMNNPIMKNAFEMAKKGDSKGVEELARNLCKEKGIDPDEAMTKVIQLLFPNPVYMLLFLEAS